MLGDWLAGASLSDRFSGSIEEETFRDKPFEIVRIDLSESEYVDFAALAVYWGNSWISVGSKAIAFKMSSGRIGCRTLDVPKRRGLRTLPIPLSKVDSFFCRRLASTHRQSASEVLFSALVDVRREVTSNPCSLFEWSLLPLIDDQTGLARVSSPQRVELEDAYRVGRTLPGFCSVFWPFRRGVSSPTLDGDMPPMQAIERVVGLSEARDRVFRSFPGLALSETPEGQAFMQMQLLAARGAPSKILGACRARVRAICSLSDGCIASFERAALGEERGEARHE